MMKIELFVEVKPVEYTASKNAVSGIEGDSNSYSLMCYYFCLDF